MTTIWQPSIGCIFLPASCAGPCVLLIWYIQFLGKNITKLSFFKCSHMIHSLSLSKPLEALLIFVYFPSASTQNIPPFLTTEMLHDFSLYLDMTMEMQFSIQSPTLFEDSDLYFLMYKSDILTRPT